MLLRRMINHVKAQNWTAVALDFVIVVVGVFLGIQVSNWNDARVEKQTAEAFAGRLVSEMQAEAVLYADTVSYYASVQENAEAAFLAVNDVSTATDEEFLISAFRATQFFWYSRRRAAYDELKSTGALNLIRDEQLRDTAVVYFNTDFIEDISDRDQNSPIKTEFGKIVPPDIHRRLRERCGDRPLDETDFANRGATLDYQCTLDLPAVELASAAAALKANAAFAPALILRISDVDATLNVLTENVRLFDFLSAYE
ncbi:MAG: hypothetical protein AAGC77_02135 [Pseudomonadota bacterium]